MSIVDSPTQSPDDIWADDLFNRRADANAIMAYLQSVAGRPAIREDHHGFTLAIDADYGTGKSFFLRRLAAQLALTHPVAFVDAWTDDLADEPLTAIAATLKLALAPLFAADKEVEKRWQQVRDKTGAVAKIVGVGLLKKAVGLAITDASANQLEDALGTLSSSDQKAADDALKDVGKIAGDGLVDGIIAKSGRALMDERISNFQAGQAAVRELRRSLSDLVKALPSQGKSSPIIIIIDELDRCRPPYAIKLLEEMKHLFDTTGVVFILGLNTPQLAKSVQVAYGQDFDSLSYLRRFIDRHYQLGYPNIEPLITHIFKVFNLDRRRLKFMPVKPEYGRIEDPPQVERMIARYMVHFGLTARDAFTVGDKLQTCLALTGDKDLFMPILLPMMMEHILIGSESAASTSEAIGWSYLLYPDDFANNTPDQIGPVNFYRNAKPKLRISISALGQEVNSGDKIASVLIDYRNQNEKDSLCDPARYDSLLKAVSKFSTSEQ